MPGCGDDQAIADPRGARGRLLAGRRIGVTAEPRRTSVMGYMRLIAHEDYAVGIRVADGDAEWSFTAFEAFPARGGFPIRRNVVAFESRVLKVNRTPGFAAV